jgi:hypothetical protein
MKGLKLTQNAMDAHAHDFLANDKLLLPILQAFIPRPLNMQCTCSPIETRDALSLCAVAQPGACQCTAQSSSLYYNQLSPCTPPDMPTPPCRDILWCPQHNRCQLKCYFIHNVLLYPPSYVITRFWFKHSSPGYKFSIWTQFAQDTSFWFKHSSSTIQVNIINHHHQNNLLENKRK